MTAEEKPRYRVDTESFTAAIAAVIGEFHRQNPSIGKFQLVTKDGTKVVITKKGGR